MAVDLGGEYGPAVTDQRHRAVFNGIWQVGYGFQLSGLYFFGSGQRQEVVCGGDRRDVQGASPPARLCANGSIVPRNNFVQDPIHRVDMRLQQRVPLGGRVSLDGIVELFNVFNRANFQSYTLDQSSPRYGEPNQSTNLSYFAAHGAARVPAAVLNRLRASGSGLRAFALGPGGCIPPGPFRKWRD